MFREYTDFNTRGNAVTSQARVGVDLTSVTGYWRDPGSGRVQLRFGGNGSYDAYMTQAEFDEFTVNLKTATRLKKAYE